MTSGHVPGSSGGRVAAGATPAGKDAAAAGAAPVEDDLPHTPSGELDLQEAIHLVEELEHEGRPPAAGPLANVLTALAVVTLGVAAMLGSWALGAGSTREPGSGTFPLLVSVVLVAMGVVLLFTARRTTDAERFTRGSWLVVAGLATMVVFVAVIGTIGFEIPAALLAFVWLRFLGHESWRTSIVTALAVVVAFYVIFVAALQVPIPHLF